MELENGFIIPQKSVVKAGNEFLPLCKMCIKSPMTCDNNYIREVEILMTEGDNPSEEIIGEIRLPDGSLLKNVKLGFRIVDGVEAGIYTSEEDIMMPFICDFFEPKSG